jgi:hypothetical protein
MKKIIFVLLVFLFFRNVGNVKAVENPLAVPNNPVGIHVLQEKDLENAANLVNSSGGDWGYVTLVIREDERNIENWQQIFDKMRRLHLIPIVRLASRQTDDGWKRPELSDIKNWVYFLNSLNWVVKNRYVVLGNEPNHANEWGGDVNPEEYTDYIISFSKQLKNASDDFFVLPAGLDASTPTSKNSVSESDFLMDMYEYNKNFSNHIDGWTSHSYPNPNFSGSESDVGRGTIKNYEWELTYLKELGVEKEFKVFITETGWAHDKDGKNNGFSSVEDISKSLTTAFEKVWRDERIVAITPFVLNYQEEPFDIFSWQKPDGEFYKFYYDVRNLSKNKGEPEQVVSGEILAVISPQIIKRGDRFFGMALVKNTGQTIWKKGEITLIQDPPSNLEIEPLAFDDIEPFDVGFIFFRGNTSTFEDNEEINARISLSENSEKIGSSYSVNIKKLEAGNIYESNSIWDRLIYFISKKYCNIIGC